MCVSTFTALFEFSEARKVLSPSFFHWMEAMGYEDTSQDRRVLLPSRAMMSPGAEVMTGSAELTWDKNWSLLLV